MPLCVSECVSVGCVSESVSKWMSQQGCISEMSEGVSMWVSVRECQCVCVNVGVSVWCLLLIVI